MQDQSSGSPVAYLVAVPVSQCIDTDVDVDIETDLDACMYI